MQIVEAGISNEQINILLQVCDLCAGLSKTVS